MSQTHFCLIIVVALIFKHSIAIDCNCKLGARKRIIGGFLADDDFIPWRVLILENRVTVCGGFILNDQYVVTAAHCVFSKQINNLEIVVGLNQLGVAMPAQNFYNLNSIIIPNDFNINRLQDGHDISLIRLDRNIQFVRGKVEAACLRFINRRIDDLFVAGFGSTKKIEIVNGVKSEGTYGYRLKYVSFYEPLKNRKKQYITGVAKKKGEDVCLKDGGEPSHILTNGKAGVVGLASFSTYEKVSDNVQTMCNGVAHFTRLSYEKKFIEFYVNKNYCLI